MPSRAGRTGRSPTATGHSRGGGSGARARLPIIFGRRGFGPSSCCAHLCGGPGRHSSVSRAPSRMRSRWSSRKGCTARARRGCWPFFASSPGRSARSWSSAYSSFRVGLQRVCPGEAERRRSRKVARRQALLSARHLKYIGALMLSSRLRSMLMSGRSRPAGGLRPGSGSCSAGVVAWIVGAAVGGLLTSGFSLLQLLAARRARYERNPIAAFSVLRWTLEKDCVPRSVYTR